MTKKQSEIFAFIDSQNLNLGVKSQGWTLDYKKFRILLEEKYKVCKAFLFIGFIPINSTLYLDLQEAGYIIVFKPVLIPRNHKIIKIKGNVDAELVLHTMINFKKFSKAIIVSGDGDFHCLIEYLVERQKLQKIIVPNQKFSSLLRKFNSYIVNINLFKNKLKA